MRRCVASGDHLRVNIGFAAVQVADGLALGGVDARIIIMGAAAAPDNRLGDYDPGIGVAEDTGIFFVSGRIRRNFAQVQIILGVGGLL